MLDLYFIDDEQKTPNYPEKKDLQVAISLPFETFEDLINTNIIDAYYSYYDDFRWSSKIVLKILNRCNEIQTNNFSDFKNVLEKASTQNYGLVAFCD